MNLPPLTVIEASAGTGKTYSLVTRLIELIVAGVAPERIVALTFSRAAAGEIFNSFIARLANAAAREDIASEESAKLGVKLERADFAKLLRTVISRQHLSLIGTLDSFLMRIVRMIPLELGLEGEVRVLSEYRSPVERMRLVGEIMRLESDDSRKVLREAFRLAFNGAGERSFLKTFSDFIEAWHGCYRERPGESEWGVPGTIWGDKPPRYLDVTIADIRAEAGKLERLKNVRGGETFLKDLAGFSGSALKPGKTVSDDSDVQRVMEMANAWRIADALSRTRGAYWLMRSYEAAYGLKVRAKGLVSFDDMPRLLLRMDDHMRLALEYRIDARFDHWALDEFQDTSRSQWRAISNLIYEGSQREGEKSVFIVGDRKQSIYEWRGGDVGILGEQAERARLPGNRLEPLNESRRYLGAISEAVNKVFGEDVVRGAFDMDSAPENAKWRCLQHESHDKSQQGFVEVVQATKKGSKANIGDFFEPIANSLNAVRPWERGLTCAILVRRNEDGEKIHAYLKSVGLDRVVFEGDSHVADSPVLAAMADLVRLAEHPSDAFAYAHILHSPLAAALWPNGMPKPCAAAAELLGEFTKKGLGRKFRETREALKAVKDSWNVFTESRFEDFIKCAAEFDEIRDSKTRLSDFAEFLDRKTRRDYAAPGVVRIMTMHKSKGLGFDHVIVPLNEYDPLAGSSSVNLDPLTGASPPWLLDHPGVAAAMGDAVLRQAEERREHAKRYGSLCLYYVAMTRAKKALTVILHPLSKTEKADGGFASPERISDLIRMVGLTTSGDKEWFRHAPPAKSRPAAPAQDAAASAALRRAPRRNVAKVRPGEMFLSGLRGDALFADDFGGAAKRGTEVHAQFEKIGWLAEDQARTALERELVEPSDDATLWREKPYEIFNGASWESGRFDRVVFWSENGERKAKICDYKTNAVRPGESVAEFSARMREAYAGQMRAYRAALSSLTGIAHANIALKLLLVAVRGVVEIA